MIAAPDDPVALDAVVGEPDAIVPAPVDAAPLVIVCPNCARTLTVEAGAARFATSDDTSAMSEDALNALRVLRRKSVEPPARNRK